MQKRYIKIQQVLDNAVASARAVNWGRPANYIPELAQVDPDRVSVAVQLIDGTRIFSGDLEHVFTLQSVSKLVPLIGLIEEYGRDEVFSWIDAEPSGASFTSIAQLEKFGAVPANPMVNAGAIALCGRIPGSMLQRRAWLDTWIARLFNCSLCVNEKVFASECLTGDRNRSLAYFLKSSGVLRIAADEALDTYFYLCSYEIDVQVAVYLGMVLANGGKDDQGKEVISPETCNCVIAIMATCGLYNESGTRLLLTGMPAKSGVSGGILAVALGQAGVMVSSPRINDKGGSIRGHFILEKLSQELGWHMGSVAYHTASPYFPTKK